MKRWINILVGLLVLQVAIFALLSYQDYSGLDTNKKAEPLLSVAYDKLDKVTIEGFDKKMVTLEKKNGKWLIPALFDFPVSEERLTGVVKRLVESQRSWPLGNTEAAAKQFEVTDEKFERKMTFYVAGKAEATLYLGNSPSFRKVYARVGKEDKSYSVEFSAFDAPVENKEWAEHHIYKLDRAKVAEFKGTDYVLIRQGASFMLNGLKPDESTNATEVDAFLTKVQNPLFEDVLASGTYETGKPLLEYAAVFEDKSERKFHYYEFKDTPKAITTAKKGEKKDDKTAKTPEDPFVVLKVSDIPYYFKVHKNECGRAG